MTSSNALAAAAAHGHCGPIDTGFVALGPLKVAFLGVVQGISELLPISSTAHLRAIPAFLGWPVPGSAFSAAMQLAALAAVIAYFWKDVERSVIGSVRAIRGRVWTDVELRLAVAVIIATVPIVFAGLALSKTLNACGSVLRAPMVIGIACLVMGGLLALAERLATHRRHTDDVTLRDGLLIGLAQVGALIPGVSRSGSTFTAALSLGFARAEAARVSFLLGIPAIAAAGAHEIWELAQFGLPSGGWLMLGLGLVVSSASSFLAIWGLMRFLQHFSTWPLVAYRLSLGIVLIAGSLAGWL
ncbi:MAG: undecaprenyl-diphosphate phosphatase [Alphaproteobacteria bacterium]|nr:undecaprenyl-diphosphate phosphatase [Alphaproteobacteria bacterium]